ncbi:MAG: hypothetical protein JXR94_12315, partial [Candidatus Hydrogenedentes bacterium]|nr:hypothetical protein [Candidatus Hydrogenedentota bacterium]
PDQVAKDWAKYGVKTVDDLATVQGEPANVPKLAEAWEIAIAEQTYGTINQVVREIDPNHLNLGVRMMSGAPPSPGVLATMGKYCDVISLNLYSVLPDRVLTEIFTVLPMIHFATGRPVMTSEFSYRGGDTLLPNTTGAPPTVPTQTDRAIGYMSYVSAVASIPFFVGASWYTYHDDPPERAWDEYGEDCNFGIVDGQERPYAALVEAMRLTNASIYELAADPVESDECRIFWRTRLTRWDKEWNTEFLRRYARTDKPIPEPLADMLPADRRYHENYWVQHESPLLTVNDDRFLGDCRANMIRKRDGGHELVLLGLRYFTSFPQSLWYGAGCDNPDKVLCLEGNPQVFTRDVDDDGRVRRMTIVDGSFIRLNFTKLPFRTDCKVAYLDLQFDHEAKQLVIVTRGEVKHLGVDGVAGWQATWNDKPAQPAKLPAPDGMVVFACPGT